MSAMKPALLVLVALAPAACRASGDPVDPPDATTPGAPDAAVDARATPDAPPGVDYCNATDPRTMPVVVDPTPEAGEAPYVDVLATAQTSIDVSIYLI